MKAFATALLATGLLALPAWAETADEKATAVAAPSENAAGFDARWAEIAPRIEERVGPLGEREALVRAYAEALWARSRNWRLADALCVDAVARLASAYSQQREPNHADAAGESVFYTLSGDCDAARTAYEAVIVAFPTTLFAAEAMYQQCVILTMTRRFEEAFARIRALVDTYPGSDRIADALTQGYMIAEMGRQGDER